MTGETIDQWIRRQAGRGPGRSTEAPEADQGDETSTSTPDLKQGDRHSPAPPRTRQPTGDEWIRAARAAQRRIINQELAHEMNRTVEGK